MDKSRFATRYTRGPKQLERGGGERLVEDLGYVPLSRRIEALVDAGVRLQAAREGEYDIGPDGELPDDYQPLGRSPNYDLADLTADAMRVAPVLDKARKGGYAKPAEPVAVPAQGSEPPPQ